MPNRSIEILVPQHLEVIQDYVHIIGCRFSLLNLPMKALGGLAISSVILNKTKRRNLVLLRISPHRALLDFGFEKGLPRKRGQKHLTNACHVVLFDESVQLLLNNREGILANGLDKVVRVAQIETCKPSFVVLKNKTAPLTYLDRRDLLAVIASHDLKRLGPLAILLPQLYSLIAPPCEGIRQL